MNIQQPQWEHSYRNRDNFLFYPHEEIIRFVSKYIRKQVGLNEYHPQPEAAVDPVKFLDVGCGIGRHLVYAHRMQLEPYGIDLSLFAVDTARRWAEAEGISEVTERIRQGDVRHLPWPDDFFQVAVSHGVFDSMHFEVAVAAIQEVSRVLGKGCLFYLDLVAHPEGSAGEETVQTAHEQGTVQSYFTPEKIALLLGDCFEVVETVLIKRESLPSHVRSHRYHLVLRNLK